MCSNQLSLVRSQPLNDSIQNRLAIAAVMLFIGANCGYAQQASFAPQLARVHGEYDWSKLTPSDLGRALGVSLVPESPSDAEDASNCDGTVFYRSEGEDVFNRVVARFDRVSRGGICRLMLQRVSIAKTARMRDAEPARGQFLDLLKPGGRPETDLPETGGVRLTFVWRSTDSHWRYDLFTAVEPQEAPATPESPALLRVMLDHTAVSPAEVDDLPFEKGYFPPNCEDRKNRRNRR